MKRYYDVVVRVLVDDADDFDYVEQRMAEYANDVDIVDYNTVTVLDVKVTMVDAK